MDICALPVGPLCRCLCNQINIFTLNSGLLLLMKEKHCELDRGEEQGVALWSQQSLPTESPPLGLSVWHSYTGATCFKVFAMPLAPPSIFLSSAAPRSVSALARPA